LKKIFVYEAIDPNNQKITGTFSGELEEFQKYIKLNNLFLISYKEKEIKLKTAKFTTKDYIYFIEELYYLISSGMSIDKAISNLIKSSSKEKQKTFLEDILKSLKEGNQLSIAISFAAKNNGIEIDNLSILLIETNESVGSLSLGLKKAQEHLEFKESIFSEIKQAISYPLFLITMSMLLVFFVFLFIVPKFAEIFTKEEFEKLPLLSKLILQAGLHVNENILSIVIFIISSIATAILFKKQIITFLKPVLLKIRTFKNLVLNLQLSYFFGAFSLMLEGGFDVKKALFQSSKILTYQPLKNLVMKTYEEIKKGHKISESFTGSDLIDANTVSLISAGENSAKLPEIFNSLSKRYLNEFNKKTKSLLSLLEPAVIIFMGGIIALIVISIMLAVMSISDITG